MKESVKANRSFMLAGPEARAWPVFSDARARIMEMDHWGCSHSEAPIVIQSLLVFDLAIV